MFYWTQIKDLEFKLKDMQQSASSKVLELQHKLEEKETRESILEMKVYTINVTVSELTFRAR